MNNSFIELLATKQNMDISEVSMYIETFVFGFATELQQNHIVHFDPYGVFEVEKELEYIVEDSNGCKTLMPPCLKASFSSSSIYGVLKNDDEEDDNAIYQVFDERYDLGKEGVSLFMAQIKSAIKSELLKNKVSYIPGFGSLEGDLGGDITFTFDESFEVLINKPFAHFTPVKLSCSEKELTSNAKNDTNLVTDTFREDEASETHTIEDNNVVYEPITPKQHVVREVSEVVHTAKNESSLAEVEQQLTKYADRIVEIEKKISTQDHIITLYKKLALFLGLILIFVLGGWYWSMLKHKENSLDSITSYEDEVVVDEPQKTFAEMEEEMFRMWEDSINHTTDTLEQSLIDVNDSLRGSNMDNRSIKTSNVVVDTREGDRLENKKQTHTLKSGDTLRSLAYKYYKDKEKWTVIYKSNLDVITNPNNVPIGTVLNIPSLQ